MGMLSIFAYQKVPFSTKVFSERSIANCISSSVVVEVGEHTSPLTFPLVDAIGPPMQIIIRVGATVEIVGVGAVEAHIDSGSPLRGGYTGGAPHEESAVNRRESVPAAKIPLPRASDRVGIQQLLRSKGEPVLKNRLGGPSRSQTGERTRGAEYPIDRPGALKSLTHAFHLILWRIKMLGLC